MKRRSGFVSNSSSASFILSKDVYPTIWDLAIDMITVRNIDHEREFGKDDAADMDADDLERAARKLAEDAHATAITFPTCNFDTYIWDAGDSWWVSTCNNHPFFELLSSAMTHTATRCSSDVICRFFGGVMDTTTRYDMNEGDLLHYIEFCMEDEHTFEKV